MRRGVVCGCRRNFVAALLATGSDVDKVFADKGALIVTKVFDVFLPASNGSFNDACALIQRVLQTHPDAVAKAIGASSRHSHSRC